MARKSSTYKELGDSKVGFIELLSEHAAYKFLKDIKNGWYGEFEDGCWADEDASIYVEYADGTSFYASIGDSMKGFRTCHMTKVIYSDSCGYTFYNAEIVETTTIEEYGFISYSVA